MSYEIVRIYIDGASRGNPGPAAFGVVAHLADGVKRMNSGKLDAKMSNQEAEFEALQKALEMAVENKWGSIEIMTDSRLVAQSSNGKWRLKSSNLVRKMAGLSQLAAQVKCVQGAGIKVTWVSREDPSLKEADELCNQSLNPKLF